jgi:protein-disulfide isomerase
MVARCAPADRFFEVVDRFFAEQDSWLVAPDLRASILAVATEFGFSDSTFEACITNEALFTGIEGEKQRGASFGVQATPTFFINGKRISGALTIAELEEEIDPLL